MRPVVKSATNLLRSIGPSRVSRSLSIDLVAFGIRKRKALVRQSLRRLTPENRSSNAKRLSSVNKRLQTNQESTRLPRNPRRRLYHQTSKTETQKHALFFTPKSRRCRNESPNPYTPTGAPVSLSLRFT